MHAARKALTKSLAIRDAAFNEFLRLIFLFWCLIQQENGPWRLENTVIPIVGALILPIVKHSFFSKTRPEFNWGYDFLLSDRIAGSKPPASTR